MAISMPRLDAIGTRPAYLDNLFRDLPNPPSVHSSISSISCSSTASSYDLRSAYHTSRPLTPAMEQDRSDALSTLSKKSFLGRRRFKLGSVLNRRTYPQSEDEMNRPTTSHTIMMAPPRTPPLPPVSMPISSPPLSISRDVRASYTGGRRPSLPTLPMNLPPPQAISTYAKRPLPKVPGQAAPQAPQPQPKPLRPALKRQGSSNAELQCQRCYYYAARNCQGYVLGGQSGDACETCLRAGYFGAK